MSQPAAAATRPHPGMMHGTQAHVSRLRCSNPPDLLVRTVSWPHAMTDELTEERMNNVVEIRHFCISQGSVSHYAGEVSKFITFWCQMSLGYRVPKIIVIFRTIPKILQIYRWGILI